jgi:hypothetical protein
VNARGGGAGATVTTDALSASQGPEGLLSRRGGDVEVLRLSPEELGLALRLQDRNEREWRRTLGMKARRLDAGEAASIAIAGTRLLPLATDDADGAAAFEALGGREHAWTRDLIKRAVVEGLLPEPEARDGYEKLRSRFAFHAPPW